MKTCGCCRHWEFMHIAGSLKVGRCKGGNLNQFSDTDIFLEGFSGCDKWQEPVKKEPPKDKPFCINCSFWFKYPEDDYGYCNNFKGIRNGAKLTASNNCPQWTKRTTEAMATYFFWSLQADLQLGKKIKKPRWNGGYLHLVDGYLLRRYNPILRHDVDYKLDWRDIFEDEWIVLPEESLAGWGLDNLGRIE